jgi:hypothetical protein
VEKFHFKGHVGTFCKKNCNPNDHPEVKQFNTVICEQRFKWVAKFKGITCMHMSAPTFNFFILLLCWLDHELWNSPFVESFTTSSKSKDDDSDSDAST